MNDVLGDLKYAVRMLWRSPGFAMVTILSLALGIGANSAIFTVTNAVLLSSLPVTDASRLVQVQTADRDNPKSLSALSLPNFEDVRAKNHVFTDMVATVGALVTLSGRGDARPLPVQLVTANYFDALGVKAYRGRTFFPYEDRTEGGNPVAVLSHAMWIDQFGGNPAMIGQTIALNQSTFTIVGIGPAGSSRRAKRQLCESGCRLDSDEHALRTWYAFGNSGDEFRKSPAAHVPDFRPAEAGCVDGNGGCGDESDRRSARKGISIRQ